MSRISIVDSRTFKKRAKNMAYLGLAAIMTYTAIRGVGYVFDRFDNNRAKKNIEAYIKVDDLDDAAKAIEIYEKNPKIDPTIYISLKHELAQARVIHEKKFFSKELDELISKGKTKEAIKKISGSRIYSKKQQDSLLNIVNKNSEDSIYSEYRSQKDPTKKVFLAERYISKFMGGTHRKEIASKDMQASYSALINSMSRNSPVQDVIQAANRYIHDLEIYRSDTIIIPKTNRKDIEQAFTKYISKTEFVEQSQIPVVSKNMQVMVNDEDKNEEEHLDPKYINERQSRIPMNTVGKIVAYDAKEGMVYVEFEKAYDWSKNWEFKSIYIEKWDKKMAAYNIDALLYSKTNQKKSLLRPFISKVDSLIDRFYDR